MVLFFVLVDAALSVSYPIMSQIMGVVVTPILTWDTKMIPKGRTHFFRMK